MKTTILKNEFWYGGAVYEGYRQPVGADDIVDWDFRENPTHNQIMPLFLSSKGRYIWSDAGFHISFRNGEILAEGPEPIILKDGFNDLRGAYLAAMKAHFPFHEIKLSDRFFKVPVYNSWIELTYYQTQKNILKYAKGILENGFPSGVLMIDDGWSPYYGRWQFRGDNFKDAKAMLKELHEMGFSVMLWICPFITPDTLEFREARDKHFLIETPEGKPRILEWWNGYSAALDLTNPDAMKWLKDQLDVLTDMGVDGFKLDAGDPCYYHAGDKLFRDVSTDELSRLWAEFGEQFAFNELRVCFRAGGYSLMQRLCDKQTKWDESGDPCYYHAGDKLFRDVSTDELSRLWAEFGEQFAFNELRVCFRAGGYSLMQRLCDKQTKWDESGIAGLIPDTLLQGLTGHPFGSPDMIGGGEYTCFLNGNENACTPEMFVRYAQIAALMPVMQFSASPWRVLPEADFQKVKAALALREKCLPEIFKAVECAKVTGEPIARSMEFVFPGQGMERVMDQFMVGDALLVAPVWKQGEVVRSVTLPEGQWRCVSLGETEGDVLNGGRNVVLGENDGLVVLRRV